MCASGTGRRVGNSSDLGSGNSGAEGAVESGIRLVFRRSSRLIPVGLARQSFSLYLSPSFSFSTPLLYFSLFLWKQGGYRALFPSELPPLPSSHRGGHVTPALLPPNPRRSRHRCRRRRRRPRPPPWLSRGASSIPPTLRLSFLAVVVLSRGLSLAAPDQVLGRVPALSLSLSSESAAEAPAYFSTG